MGAFWRQDEDAGCLPERSFGGSVAPEAAAPAVSVMMEVGDDGSYLDEALASLSRQTFDDFEIVLAHVGNSEATARIIRGWCAREPRLRVFETAPLPLAQAHNLVARQARGRFLARLDADDVALPTRLAIQHEALRANPRLGIVGGAAEVIDAGGNRLCVARYQLDDRDIRLAMANSCPFAHSAMMVRADAFWAVGGYRAGLNISEDYDLYARLIEHCQGANLATTVIRYRVHAASITSRSHRRMAITAFCVMAARSARARGLEEPFVDRGFSLRRAQRIAGLSRAALRRAVRVHSLRIMISRRMLLLPLPASLKSAARALALRIGGRALYLGLLRLWAALTAPWLEKRTAAAAAATRA